MPFRNPAEPEWFDWDEFLDEAEFKKGQHHTLIGQTGCGKSYLLANGIVPELPHEKQVIIDVKGDDPTWHNVGRPVEKIPNKWIHRFVKPRSQIYRLIVSDDRTTARRQVVSTLNRVYAEGDWGVIVDETRALTDPKPPNLNVQPWLDRLWLRGRSRDISVVAASQAPRYIPSSMYDQATHIWFGRLMDRRVRIRMREIAGFSDEVEGAVGELEKHHWLYIGDYGDWLAVTKVD